MLPNCSLPVAFSSIIQSSKGYLNSLAENGPDSVYLSAGIILELIRGYCTQYKLLKKCTCGVFSMYAYIYIASEGSDFFPYLFFTCCESNGSSIAFENF